MSVLVAKLALAPTFVVLVSMVARRYGPRIGGVVGGLPVVAGPILLVLALQDGTAFAAEAARSSVLSLSGLTAFVVVCARTPARVPSCVAVLAGWGVFASVGVLVAAFAAVDAGGAFGLSAAGGHLVVALLLSVAVFIVALRWMLPSPAPHVGSASRPPHDLLLRGATAAVMVVAVTSASDALGPAWSGVLAPFPTVTSVLAGFSLAHDPRPTTQALLRSMVVGFFSFVAFLATVAATLESWGIAGAFLAAVAITAAIQVVILVAFTRAQTGAVAAAAATDGRPLPAAEAGSQPRERRALGH